MRPFLGSVFSRGFKSALPKTKLPQRSFTSQRPLAFTPPTVKANPLLSSKLNPFSPTHLLLKKPFLVGGALNFGRDFSTQARKPISPTGMSSSPVPEQHQDLFNEEYYKKLRALHGEFYPRFIALQNQRKADAVKAMRGEKPTFREDTRWIRDDKTWQGGKTPEQLQDRRVEITGPAGDAKMVINALNSGANCFMADFEDSQSPAWQGVLAGHKNLKAAHENQLTFEKRNAKGEVEKTYELNDETATLLARARGLHMFEQHMIDESGRPMNAMLFDVFTYIYNNIEAMRIKGEAPYIYIPKLESYEEAVLVHDMIKRIEESMGMEHGSVKVTALIETLPGLMQAEEIIYGLGEYCVGLNCGRWDYLFSAIKNNAYDKNNIFPDRGLLTMDREFLTHYMQHIVKVCHSRGIHAMGGMSAFIPTKNAEETARVMEKVKADKQLEIDNGCDGAWVAHPGMVKPIQDLFTNAFGGKPNQREATVNLDNTFKPEDFYKVPHELKGPENFTEKNLRQNISVGIQYLTHWLNGSGAVAINNLMEDMATAEISRLQVWQWLHHAVEMTFDDGTVERLSDARFNTIFDEEVEKLYAQDLPKGEFIKAKFSFHEMVTAENFIEFIQDEAYQDLNRDVVKPIPSNLAFDQHVFPQDVIESLQGSHPELESQGSINLTKHRGEFLNKTLGQSRSDGLTPHYTYLGVLDGSGATNVTAGGKSKLGPYAGGWQSSADHKKYRNTFPDTLMVGPEAPAELAEIFNNHLLTADKVQQDKLRKKFSEIKKLPKHERDAAKKASAETVVKYFDVSVLADLEQGYNDAKKIAYAVTQCILHGVNVMHIEDQGPAKRCGHLGGKELAVLDDWKLTMRTANLAAQLLLGDEQTEKKHVRFVARTDALSAERIQYSEKLKDPSHPDHSFVDWLRGASPDGKYLYLKKGINPDTGNPYGLDHSIVRAAAIVADGLASHVWMETPDANLAVAKDFLDGVNKILALKGLRACGLYNHSPSFPWPKNYFRESKELGIKLGNYIKKNLVGMHPEKAKLKIRAFLDKHGDHVRGDYNFTEDRIEQLYSFGLDLNKSEDEWRDEIQNKIDYLKENFGNSKPVYRAIKALERNLEKGYQPERDIINVIVGQRIFNFDQRLTDYGFNLLLTTLPHYRVNARIMHELASLYLKEGIHAFVRHQRLEDKYVKEDPSYTYIDHQTATGTGLEVNLNEAVGSHTHTGLLSGSTEADGHRAEAMEGGKPSNTGLFAQTAKRNYSTASLLSSRYGMLR